jgi:hypothetical protein
MARLFFITFAFAVFLFLPTASARELLAAERPDKKAEWEKTLKAAKAEGQVTVYGWSRDSHVQALNEFQKIYPELSTTT